MGDRLPHLHGAVRRFDLKHVRREIRKGADVNGVYKGRAPLHRAVTNNDLGMAQYLIENGADASVKDMCGSTALHTACSRTSGNNHDIIKLLLENGADCNARDNRQTTPLHWALANSNNLESVKLLVTDHGADITALDSSGHDALHWAARNQRVCMAEFILNRGLLDVECDNGYSALHSAISHDNVEVCEFLLKRGARVNRKFDSGTTPLISALLQGSSAEVVEVLIKYGANLFDECYSRSVLRLADIYRQQYIHVIKRLVHAMAAMELLDLRINDYDRGLIENRNVYKEYYDEQRKACLEEFEGMKHAKFYHNVTVFRIFMGSNREVCGFARNEELIQALEVQGYEHQFPIYFALLKKRFLVEVERQRLRNDAALVLRELLMLNDPLHPVPQKILDYLQDKDLRLLTRKTLLQDLGSDNYQDITAVDIKLIMSL